VNIFSQLYQHWRVSEHSKLSFISSSAIINMACTIEPFRRHHMTVPRTRIFISYSHTENDSQIARQLVSDLRYKGFDVASDNSSQNRQQIAQSDWVVLVRTPSALQDKQVNNVVDTALDIVSQRSRQKARLQNIVAFGAGPVDDPEKWPTIRTYNAGLNPAQPENYHQALDKMVKTLSYVRTPDPEQQLALSGSGYRPSTISTLPRHSSPNPKSSISSLKKIMIGVVTLLTLFFLVSTSWVIYVKNGQSNKQQSANATATARVHVTATEHAKATATEHAKATATARANVTATAQANVTATAMVVQWQTAIAVQPTPPANLSYANITRQKPDSTYAFTNSSRKWDNIGNGCALNGSQYQVTNSLAGHYTTCMGQSTNLQNDFAYQVTMSISNGGYAGGIIWRSNAQVTTFYQFSLIQNGTYSLLACLPCSSQDRKITDGQPLPNEPTELPIPNLLTATLTLIATGNTFYLYVNDNFITSVQDPTPIFNSGEIGMYAASGDNGTPNTEVTFSNLKVWPKLSQ
jgi:TIR domain